MSLTIETHLVQHHKKPEITLACFQEYVTDPDTGPNRVHAFYPVGDYELDKDLEPSFGPSDTPLMVTISGTVATHAALPGDARGFFTWEIMVNDTAGNDSVILKVCSCLSVCVAVCLCVRPSDCLSDYLSVSVSVCLSVSLSASLSEPKLQSL